MRIQKNIAALNSYRNMETNRKGLNKNLEKLASGYRINRAGDDAAGLAISEKMRSQITGLNTAIKNAGDGISLVQTAEGALTEVHAMLNRMVELATQSSNGIYENGDRNSIMDEFDHLKNEIDRISEGTDFNKKTLFDGSVGNGKQIKFEGTNGENKYGINLQFNFPESATNMNIDIHFNMAQKDKVKFNEVGGSPQISIYIPPVDYRENAIYPADQISNDIKEELQKSDALDNITQANKDEFVRLVTGMTVEGFVLAPSHRVPDPKDLAVQPQFTNKTEGYQEVNKQIDIQIGDTDDPFNVIGISIRKINSESLGLNVLSLESESLSANALTVINIAVELVSQERGKFGAMQNRLEHTVNNLSVAAENMTAAESGIRDADMADEMMGYTRNSILLQASQAMLAQANQQPQSVLQLLQ